MQVVDGPPNGTPRSWAGWRSGSLILVVTVGLIACGGRSSPTTPSQTSSPFTETLETAGVTFHFGSGDSVNAAWQQAFHEWATTLLGVSPTARLQYYKYRTTAEARAASGANYRSWADISTFSIHTPDAQHGHEAIHLYTSLIGWPTDYFLEGLAVGLNLDPFTGAGPFYINITDDNAHALARTALMEGRIIPIESIVESDTFWTRPETTTYPQAGSFVNFLFDEYGVEKLKALASSLSHSASKETVKSVFEATYAFSLGEAEGRWHTYLREWGAVSASHITPLFLLPSSRIRAKRVFHSRHLRGHAAQGTDPAQLPLPAPQRRLPRVGRRRARLLARVGLRRATAGVAS